MRIAEHYPKKPFFVMWYYHVRLEMVDDALKIAV